MGQGRDRRPVSHRTCLRTLRWRERDERREIRTRTSGAMAQLEPSERLDPPQVAVFQEPAECGRGDVSADGVQPAAANSHTRSRKRGYASTDFVERCPGSNEKPHRQGRVLNACQRARQHRGHRRLLRCQPRRQDDEPEEPPHQNGEGGRGKGKSIARPAPFGRAARRRWLKRRVPAWSRHTRRRRPASSAGCA